MYVLISLSHQEFDKTISESLSSLHEKVDKLSTYVNKMESILTSKGSNIT